MNSNPYSQLLDKSVAEKIPETTDITPRVLARLESRKIRFLQVKFRPVALLGLVFLAVLTLATAVYAVYRLALDPGLQSVQDAGLVTDINVTAQPTLLPTSTALATLQAASILPLSQTAEGVTLTLDWVFVDENRLALGLNFTELPAGTSLEAPLITWHNVTPLQAQGYSQSFRSDKNQAVYVSYQVIHALEIDGNLNIDVTVPLVQHAGEQANKLAIFQFALSEVPVYTGSMLPIEQTYAVRQNGVEVRLKSVWVMPSATEVVACYDFPTDTAPFWYMQHATVQIDDGIEVAYQPYQYLNEITDDHCVKLGFPAGSAGGARQLVFRVHQFTVPLTMQDALPEERIQTANIALSQYGIEIKPAPAEVSEGPGGWQFVRKPEPGKDPLKDPNLLVLNALQEKMDGLWEFYVDIPSAEIIPGREQPTSTATQVPLGSQTQGNVTMTLEWAFADAMRLAVGYTITGLQDVPDAVSLSGFSELGGLDGWTDGNAVGGTSTIERVEGQPGLIRGSQSVLFMNPLTQTEGQFRFRITLGSENKEDIIANFPIPIEATPYPPGELPPPLPAGVVGTFSFDFGVQIYPLVKLQPGQKVTANGLEMSLETIEMTPSYARLGLCYQKPSPEDWMLGGSTVMPTFEFGGYTATNYAYSLDYDVDSGGYFGKTITQTSPPPAGYDRCVSIDFLLGNSAQTGQALLTVPDITRSVPEVIPDGEIQSAREKLLTQGIELQYTTSSFASGGGGGGPTFSKLPEGMDASQAYQQFLVALGYVYPGPWQFVIDVPMQ